MRALAAASLLTTVAAVNPKQAHCSDVCDLIKGQSYPCECHNVTTSDGFVLQTVRIPAKPGAKVAWLTHGFLDSAPTWVSQPEPSSNLGFMLADAGYDVWLGNSRGNVFALTNHQMDINGEAFWKAIDFDKMASIDVPTDIEYALNVTGAKDLYYTGHSQGTLQMFAAIARGYKLSDGSTVASRVRVAAMLAPVCFIHHTPSKLLQFLAEVRGDELVKLIGFKQFLGPGSAWLSHKLTAICDLVPAACPVAMWPVMGGGNFSNAKAETYNTITRWDPADSSTWNIVHWAQQARNEVFQMHDYGKKENMKVYGQATPPQYDLTKVVGTKLAIFHGMDDDLSDPKDVAHLLELVPKETVVYEKTLDNYGHLDFIWGMDAHTRVYSDVLKVFSQN